MGINLPAKRMFGLGWGDHGKPPTIHVLLATANQPAASAAGTGAGSLVQLTATGGTYGISDNTAMTLLFGLTERNYDLGATPAANTFWPVTLIAPFFFYEASHKYSNCFYNSTIQHAPIDDASGHFAVIGSATSATVYPICTHFWPGYENHFKTDQFISEAGTSETAGALNQPEINTKGHYDNAGGRVMITFLQSACLVGR